MQKRRDEKTKWMKEEGNYLLPHNARGASAAIKERRRMRAQTHMHTITEAGLMLSV